jgi:uncharacterized protein YdeI (YjbR/CyaY-like superfamily)
MEMAYRDRWEAEIAEMRRVLAGFAMHEECKWGKPTYIMDGKNIVILQGFKEYFGLGFFQGALLKDRKKLLARLGQVHAGRVMKFTSAKDIAAMAATIKAYVREAIAVEKAGLRIERKKTSDFPVPEELRERFRMDPRFKHAFDALTPGRQRGYLYHFAAAKRSATRVARIKKAMPAIFEGRGFLERRQVEGGGGEDRPGRRRAPPGARQRPLPPGAVVAHRPCPAAGQRFAPHVIQLSCGRDEASGACSPRWAGLL